MKKRVSTTMLAIGFVVIMTAALAHVMLPGSAMAQNIVIESMYKPPISTTDGTGLIDLVTKERFNRIGVKVEIHLVPSARALEQANSGVYDGDIMRVGGASEKFPNLIQIPGTVYTFDFVAFTKDLEEGALDVEGEGCESLKPYKVAVPSGWVETTNHVSEDNTTALERVTSPPKLFMTLQRRKSDLIIYERLMGYQLIKELELKGIHVLEPPLSSKEMFLYIHKKHEALVPQLVEALEAMKADGTFQKFVDQALSEYTE